MAKCWLHKVERLTESGSGQLVSAIADMPDIVRGDLIISPGAGIVAQIVRSDSPIPIAKAHPHVTLDCLTLT